MLSAKSPALVRGAVTLSAPSLNKLAARVAELEAERETMLRLAQTDALTGLLNRAAFAAALAERLGASSAPVALLVVNLDRFKQLNDSL